MAPMRNGEIAIKLARAACELSQWRDPAYIDTLAAAYAEAGQFGDAVKWQEEAVKQLGGQPSSQERARLALYRQGLPYRQD